MTTWERTLHCERTRSGETFTILERARETAAIRRTADVITFSEADLRVLLDSLGESADRITEMVELARQRADAAL
jgi:hypothetical protein